MRKIFNTAGPCNNSDHYMISTTVRNPNLMDLIEQKQYFVIHASRQSGKTTLIRDLINEINAGSDYYGLYVSLEVLQEVRDPKDGVFAILESIQEAIEFHPKLSKFSFGESKGNLNFSNALKKEISKFCIKLDKPLVVMFDEADCLRNGTLISFLRQLRSGYIGRENIPFIHSLSLVGMRNIRDYKGKIREDNDTLGSASPFNIVTESLTIRNFTIEEISELLGQHKETTGQEFSKEIVEKLFYYTQGQPWLVNALAYEIVHRVLKNDNSKLITIELVDSAVKTIILRRDTHIDSLLERLKEDRVRKVLEPIILGNENAIDLSDDDYQYIIDLGLIEHNKGEAKPSNPIYAEVIVRALTYNSQYSLKRSYENKFMSNDIIDMDALLKDFQEFWRENSDIWVEKYQYKEAAPHLIIMAFFQRVINGGGEILREYAAGRGRIDLCILFKGRKYPIELKLYSGVKAEEKGIEQTLGYMDKMDCTKGWLVIFNRDEKISWAEKIFTKLVSVGDKKISIFGC